MTCNASHGALANLYYSIGDGLASPGNGVNDYLEGTPDAAGRNVGEEFEFLSESMSASTQILDTGGIRGTRSIPSERIREGIRTVGGSIVMNPSPYDLRYWLRHIMGAAATTTGTYNPGDSYTAADLFSLLIDKVGDRHEYVGCCVNRTIFRGQVGGLIEMQLDIVAKDEHVGTKTTPNAPALPAGHTFGSGIDEQPYTFHEMSIDAISGISAPECFDFELTIDNFFDVRFTNSQTATSKCPTDRLVTLSLTVPYASDEVGLYRDTTPGSASAGETSMAFTHTVGASTVSTTFTFGDLRGVDQTPTVDGKGEIVLQLNYVARSSGATDELVIVNDFTV